MNNLFNKNKISPIRYITNLSNIRKSKIAFYFLLILGILINLFIALLPPNFFHPDEVYQTLEIAHRIVYKYGIVSWEWQVGSFKTNSNPSGYGPIRSLFTPLIFATIFVFGEGLKLNYWTETLPLIRIVMILNFLFGIFLASKLLKEIDPDTSSQSNKIFLILAIFYQDFLIYGSKTLTNTLVASMVFFPLYIWVKSDINERKDNWALEGLGGFIVGAAFWIRPDSAILMGFFVLLYLEKINLRKILTFGIGFVISALANGLLDLLYYKSFFISFPNFIRFNSENQSYFGTEPFGWYFKTIIIQRGTLIYLFLIINALIICFLLKFIRDSYLKKNIDFDSIFIKKFILLVKLTLWCILVLFWWEIQPHKEERFIVAWEIAYLMLGSYSIAIIVKYLESFIRKRKLELKNIPFSKIVKNILNPESYGLVIILTIVLCTPFAVSNVNEATKDSWNNFKDVLESFVWIGEQNNTIGVAIMMPFFYSGGYSYLHQNVPIYNFENASEISSLYPTTNVFFNSSNKIFIPKILKENHLINYLVIPKYRYYESPDLYNLTVSSGFTLVHVIFNSSDIWMTTT